MAADVHTWPDVAYLGLLVLLALANVWHNMKVSRKADAVKAEVVDVKRATGLTNRLEDPDPAEPAPAVDLANAPIDQPIRTPDAPHRRHTDS